MKEFYTVEELANILGVDPESIRRWIRNGKLKADKKSNKKGNKIFTKDIDAFLEHTPRQSYKCRWKHYCRSKECKPKDIDTCHWCKGSSLAGRGLSLASSVTDAGVLGEIHHEVHMFQHKVSVGCEEPGWFIEYDEYLVSKDDPGAATRVNFKMQRINFCPFCGRKLDEE